MIQHRNRCYVPSLSSLAGWLKVAVLLLILGIGFPLAPDAVAADQRPIVQWQKLIPGTGFESSIQQTSDGGYIIAGETLVRTDETGTESWRRTDVCQDLIGYTVFVQPTRDDGFVLTGTTPSSFCGNESGDVIVIKTDALGNQVWPSPCDLGGSSFEVGENSWIAKCSVSYYVREVVGGGFVVLAATCEYRNENGLTTLDWTGKLFRVSISGEELWPGPVQFSTDDFVDFALSVQETEDAGYLIAVMRGEQTSEGSPSDLTDCHLIKISPEGEILWERPFQDGDPLPSLEALRMILRTADGGYVAVSQNVPPGRNDRDIYVWRVDNQGNQVWAKYIGGSEDEIGTCIRPTADGGYIILGNKETASGEWEAYLIKLEPDLELPQIQPPNTAIVTADIDAANGTAKFTWTGSDDTTPVKDLVYCYRLADDSEWSSWNSDTTKSYTNLSPGEYRFEVRAKDADDAIDPSPASRDFTIQKEENQQPIADAGADQFLIDVDGDGNETISLDGSSSDDPDGSIESYVWREDGTQIGTGVNPSLALSVGLHEIVLTVTDDRGATDTDEVSVIVAIPGHTVSTPNVPSGPSSGLVDEVLTFSTSGSTCSQGHPVQYQFEWGAEEKRSDWISDIKASYAFAAEGTYQIRARARCSENVNIISSWSSAHIVTISATEMSEPLLARVTAAKRRIRSAPDTESLDNVITTLIQGWLLEVIRTTDANGNAIINDGYEWWEVREASYQDTPITGWIAAKDAGGNGKAYVELLDIAQEQILPTELPGYMADETFHDFLEERITWGERSTGWVTKDGTTRCLAFVRSFYRSPRKYASPKDALKTIEKQGRLFSPSVSWNPPKGAIIFLDPVKQSTQSKYGHIGVYIGDGEVLHVKDYKGNVGKAKLSSLTGYSSKGYSYVGWCFPEVLGFVWVGQIRVVTERVRVRDGHSTSKDVKELLPIGTQIEILEHEDNWTYQDGYHWWYVGYTLDGVQDTGWCAELYHWAFLGSPGELAVYDEQGHATGVVEGISKEDIPWSQSFPNFQEVSISALSDDVQYVYKVSGTSTGLYSLTIGACGEATVRAVSIPTLPGAVHRYVIDWDLLAQSGEGVTVEIDSDGDGIFERIITSDDELLGDEFSEVPTGQVVNNGPNPVASAGTAFFYTLPDGTSTAKLMILSPSGRLMFETVLDADSTRFPDAGTWDPVDQDGASLANGPYIYVLIADGKVIGQGKMVIQR